MAVPAAPMIEPEPLAVSPPSTAAPRLGADGRPVFVSDGDLVRWMIANPDKVTERDRAFVREDVVNTHSGRELLRMEGVDLDALRAVLRPALSQPEPVEERRRA